MRLFWIDFIRAVAIINVVLLHSAAFYLYQYKTIPLSYWMIANIYDSYARIGVPLFFMISGYLLINKEEEWRTFFQKRIKKIVIPLVVWSIFFISWRHFYEHNFHFSLKEFSKIVIQPVFFHLWFMYAILGLYFTIPILKLLRSHHKIIIYYLVLWYIAVAYKPIFEPSQKIEGIIIYDLSLFSGFAGYLLLGYYVGQQKIKPAILWFIFLLSTSITIIGTFILSHLKGSFVGFFYNYNSATVIPASYSAFLLLKNYSSYIEKRHISTLIIQELAKCSLGIYLIHVVFLILLNNGSFGFQLNGLTWHPIIGIPLTAFITLILSYPTIRLIKAIPIIGKIIV